MLVLFYFRISLGSFRSTLLHWLVITSHITAITFATLLLFVVAFPACGLPALKSARVDPLVALRDGNQSALLSSYRAVLDS